MADEILFPATIAGRENLRALAWGHILPFRRNAERDVSIERNFRLLCGSRDCVHD